MDQSRRMKLCPVEHTSFRSMDRPALHTSAACSCGAPMGERGLSGRPIALVGLPGWGRLVK